MKTLQELQQIREAMQVNIANRAAESDAPSEIKHHVLVCGGTGCTSGNSTKIHDELVARVKAAGVEKALIS